MDMIVVSQELSVSDAKDEIRELEARLAEAWRRLEVLDADQVVQEDVDGLKALAKPQTLTNPAEHFLLLLADSALPLGAFAFSSGLESFLAHTTTPNSSSQAAAFTNFLPSSVSAFASTNLPFALAAHDDPSSLLELDDTLDATTICTVGRRASTAQGRALLSLWEKSFVPTFTADKVSEDPVVALSVFAGGLRKSKAAGHLSPVFGAVSKAAGLSRERMAYVLVLGHVKALVSAAVRAGVLGPYKAQGVLAGEEVRALISAAVEREWETKIEDAGQTVPVMDLWIGRHEVLYSRIFNS